MKLTILMPCLNEARTLPDCIRRASSLLEAHAIEGEILISDNGSTDGSQEIAEKLGARVISCPTRGYGAALMYGITHAAGEYVIMGDSDESYHFDEAYPMYLELERGFDVCMGTRLKGRILPGAMPKLNYFIGNPALTFIGRLLFNIDTTDFNCGMRAFRRDRILEIGLVTAGMEWASEMIIKSRLNGLSMTEVPITLYKDGRNRRPHLNRWRDGWRHLRFMILHAPTWLFIYPGALLVASASLLGVLLFNDTLLPGAAHLDVFIFLAVAFMIILGIQTVFTGLIAKIYANNIGVMPTSTPFIEFLRRFSLEKLLIIALVIGISGLIVSGVTAWDWYGTGFRESGGWQVMKRIIPAFTLITISGQVIFNGFILSILFLKTSCSAGTGIHDKLE